MTKRSRSDRDSVALQAALIAGFVLFWWLLSASGFFFERLFPSPWKVSAAAVGLVREGVLLPHFLYSLYEILWGLALGASAGFVIGLFLGWSRFFGEVVEPLILSLAPVPKIIVYPIFIWFLGIGMASRVAMGVASTFFPMAIYTASAVRQVKPIHLEAAQLLGASRFQLLAKICLPSILPSLWVGIRLGMAISVVSILMAETKISQQGLGFLVIEYYNHFQIAEMYSVLLLVFCFAVGLNSLFDWLEGHIPALRHSGRG